MVATGVLPWVSVLAAGMTRNQLAMSMVTISVVTVIFNRQDLVLRGELHSVAGGGRWW